MNKNNALFVAAMAGALVSLWVFFRPSHPPESFRIGVARWVSNEEYDRNIAGFKEALAAAGLVEGQAVTYTIKNPNLDSKKQEAIIRSFKQKKVDLIYSLTTPGTLITKRLAPDIPIVFSIVTYPVEAGVIASLQNSENNLVGTRNWVPIEEQLEVFHAVVPHAKVIGFVHRKGESNSTIQYAALKKAGASRGIIVLEIAPANLGDLKAALNAAKGKVDSLYSSCDTLVQGGGEEIIIAFAQANNFPDFTCNKSGVQKGSIIGLIADFYQIGKLAGEKAAKILRGASPSMLMTNTVARPFLYVNKRRADALGLVIPQDLLSRAKEVIR
ncbi:MAG: hypothetical protein COB53_05585 [Elusimicrobia bacterium]|nr:MAG: hypothetical protein COB53_05585 [Elusimicrobiota bacterium]